MELPVVYQLHRPDGPMEYFHSWTEQEVRDLNRRLRPLGYEWRPYERDEIPITIGAYCVEDAIMKYLSDPDYQIAGHGEEEHMPEVTPFGGEPGEYESLVVL